MRRCWLVRSRPSWDRRRSGTDAASAELSAVELFDLHGVAVYSLARAMVGDTAAGDLVWDVLVEAADRGERSRARLLVDTHRRAVARLRCARRTQGMGRPDAGSTPGVLNGLDPAAMNGLDPVATAALQLVCFDGYTASQAASHLDRPRDDVLRALRSAVDELSRRLPPP
jgi:DNA-directed RNA polymerase specialized sigma24 family protein